MRRKDWNKGILTPRRIAELKQEAEEKAAMNKVIREVAELKLKKVQQQHNKLYVDQAQERMREGVDNDEIEKERRAQLDDIMKYANELQKKIRDHQ
jgi:hypothetical protein